jgi:hypothetical protein
MLSFLEWFRGLGEFKQVRHNANGYIVRHGNGKGSWYALP